MFKNKNLLYGFTLAEVLITLAVIGVVAVLAIGIFMPKIQDKVLAMQAKTAKIKFTKATEQMALNNKIGPFYQDTEEFVSELQNYLKVAKICDNEHLKDCLGYREFTLANGATYDIDDLKDGKGFNLPKDNTSDFEGDTVGLVTIDGTPMVLAWNKKCEILEPGVYEWSGNTNISTSCVTALMDVNGTKRPDRLGKDIILLNASNIGACIQFTVNGTTYKWGCPFLPTPLTYSQCIDLKNAGKISNCMSSSNWQWTSWDGDRWASAVRTCGGTDKMPSPADLAALVTYLYDQESNPVGVSENRTGVKMNAVKLNNLNTSLSEFYFSRQVIKYNSGNVSIDKNRDFFSLWHNREDSEDIVYGRDFSPGGSGSYGNYRSTGHRHAVCKI